jgi:hypothetical protein
MGHQRPEQTGVQQYYRAIPTARVQKKKSLSEGRVIDSLGRKLNLAFRRNYDCSGNYYQQSTVG